MKRFASLALAFVLGALAMYIGLWIHAGLSFIQAIQKMNGA